MFLTILQIPRRFGRQKTANYIAELDGLRCLAIVLVLLWHSSLRADRFLDQSRASGHAAVDLYGYFPHGEIGVALFFFISGFVVAKPFLARPRSQWSIRSFYWRRLVRIYPPYFIALTGCFVILGLMGWVPKGAQAFAQQNVSLLDSYVASLFYLHSIIIGTVSRLNPPMWSLEIEVLFYATVPLVLLLYTSAGSVRRRCVIGGSVVLASILVNSLLVGLDFRLRLGLLSHLYILLFGVIVADVASEWDPQAASFRHDLLTVAGLVLLLIAGLSMTEHDAKMPSSIYALVLQTSILIALLALYVGAMTGRLSRIILTNPWICLIGTMCYSIYLTHIVTMQVLSQILERFFLADNPFVVYPTYFIVLICPSILIAFVYYLVVERPFAQGRFPDLSVGAWCKAYQSKMRNYVSVR